MNAGHSGHAIEVNEINVPEIDTESVNRVLESADPEIVAEIESVIEAAKSSTNKSRSSS